MKQLKAGSVVAGVLWGEQDAHLADRHGQRFTSGTQLSLQVPPYPDASRGTRPLDDSPKQFPFGGQLSSWWPTAGTDGDPR